MKKVLFKLNEFCTANRIEYILTGTAALSLLGVPSNFVPQDMDIKIFHITDEQRAKLEELQFLSGLKNENYENSACYSFMIDNTKINVIVDNEYDYDRIAAQTVDVRIIDEKEAAHHFIGVQRVDLALTDKMKLKRSKDYKYMHNLIHILTGLGA